MDNDSNSNTDDESTLLPIGCHIGGNTNYIELIMTCNLPIIQMMFDILPNQEQRVSIQKALFKKSTQLVIHAPYTINLAQPPNSMIGKKSLAVFLEQIKFTSEITPKGRTNFIVVHVGESLDLDLTEAIEIFYQQIHKVLEVTPANVMVLLESPAGQGTEIFTDLKDLFKIYHKLKSIGPFGLCIDTCHIFSAGYTIDDFLQLKDTSNAVKLIHLNDSQTPKGSGIDRHASIGTGFIFDKSHGGSFSALEDLVNWAVKNCIPIVLETSSKFHQDEINYLYQIAYPDKAILIEKWCIELFNDEDEIIDDEDEIIDGEDEIIEDDDQLIKGVSNNDRIVEILNIIAQSTDNCFRKLALFKAIDVIHGLDFEITKKEEIIRYQGIGKGIGDKVHEILTTGTLKEYEEKKDEMDAIKNLSQISGIGPVTARNLYLKKGIKTIDQLAESVKKQETKLTKGQASGLKYHVDIKKRIPRLEINRFSETFSEICREIDDNLKHIIVGSYRRKKIDSGDIDVLFSHPELASIRDVHGSNILEQIITAMESRDMIDSILSQGKNKILMIAHLPNENISRRIDFLLTPTESHAASLLYFTGSKEFNLIARRQAIKLKYKLNEYGLFDQKGLRIPTPNEKSIFDLLKFKYLQPEEREEIKKIDIKSPSPKLKAAKSRYNDVPEIKKEQDVQDEQYEQNAQKVKKIQKSQKSTR